MFNDRKVVFKALVGSHNYNLNDETSDKDWKYFVLPTFDDLYTGKYFSTSKVGTEEDYDAHDIRRLTELFWKANVNFLEVLYSKEIEFPIKEVRVKSLGGGDMLYTPKVTVDHTPWLLQNIFDLRDSIAIMNLPYLYSACKGMFHEKMKRIQSPTSGTQGLMDKHGYDTKQALHSYRILDFIVRFHKHDWDFKEAMTYHRNERRALLSIKHGGFTLPEFKDMVNSMYTEEFLALEDTYKSMAPNLETKATLESLVKEMVRRNI